MGECVALNDEQVKDVQKGFRTLGLSPISELGLAINNDYEKLVRIKKCPRCKESFECSMGGCWCEQVRLSAAMLKWLDRTFDDCLCPACLAEYAVGS